jgi:hypothetical protein
MGLLHGNTVLSVETRVKYVILVKFINVRTLKTCRLSVNPLMPNGHYSGRTAPLTSRRCILSIYSTNIRTEYFKHAT